MRTKEEIREMVERCEALRKVMPQISMFGKDNWASLGKQVEILNKSKDMSESEIKRLINVRVDDLESMGEDWSNDDIVKIYDWLVNETDDPVEDGDIEVFTKKKGRRMKKKKKAIQTRKRLWCNKCMTYQLHKRIKDKSVSGGTYVCIICGFGYIQR